MTTASAGVRTPLHLRAPTPVYRLRTAELFVKVRTAQGGSQEGGCTFPSSRRAGTGVASSAFFLRSSSSPCSSSAFFSGVTVVIKLVWEMPFVVAYWPVPTSAADIESFMYISWFSFTDARSKYNRGKQNPKELSQKTERQRHTVPLLGEEHQSKTAGGLHRVEESCGDFHPSTIFLHHLDQCLQMIYMPIYMI